MSTLLSIRVLCRSDLFGIRYWLNMPAVCTKSHCCFFLLSWWDLFVILWHINNVRDMQCRKGPMRVDPVIMNVSGRFEQHNTKHNAMIQCIRVCDMCLNYGKRGISKTHHIFHPRFREERAKVPSRWIWREVRAFWCKNEACCCCRWWRIIWDSIKMGWRSTGGAKSNLCWWCGAYLLATLTHLCSVMFGVLLLTCRRCWPVPTPTVRGGLIFAFAKRNRVLVVAVLKVTMVFIKQASKCPCWLAEMIGTPLWDPLPSSRGY